MSKPFLHPSIRDRPSVDAALKGNNAAKQNKNKLNSKQEKFMCTSEKASVWSIVLKTVIGALVALAGAVGLTACNLAPIPVMWA